jgi:hypothetical protein
MASTGSMSGMASTSHFGGVAVGVPRTTLSPWECSVSIACFSQPNSYCPCFGSSRDQANSPMRTNFSPSSDIRLASSAHHSCGQCSG